MSKKIIRGFRTNMTLYSLCLIAFVAVTVPFQPLLAAAEGLVALLVILVGRRRNKMAQASVRQYMDRVSGGMDTARSSNMLYAPLPMLVFDVATGEILWCNDMFTDLTGLKDKIFETAVDAVIPDFTYRWLLDGKREYPEQFRWNDRIYRVFGALSRPEPEGGDQPTLATTYWMDITEAEQMRQTLELTKPLMAILMVDNYEELMKACPENKRSALLAALEEQLNNWAAGSGGLLLGYDRDRYLYLFEEKDYTGYTESKFDVLEKVRQVQAGEGVSATLSIGVGRDEDSFEQLFKNASLALEMALSRGGDQAAVKTVDGFEFYGGISHGVEKRSHVRSRIIANALCDLIKRSDSVIIMGHRMSDLDAVGSAIGVLRICKMCDVPAVIAINSEATLAGPLLKTFLDAGEGHDFIAPDQTLDVITPNTLLIVVDTYQKRLLESQQIYEKCKHVVVIDHHRMAVGHIDNPTLICHEPYASSASELVCELLQFMPKENNITPLEAQALLAGIMLDTRSFALHVGVRTFEAAAWLRSRGAQTADTKLLFNTSKEEYEARAHIVEAAYIYKGCAIALSDELEAGMNVVLPMAANDLLTINGVDASFVAVAKNDGVNISARSMGALNVQVILEPLGGGGHLMMAGAQLQNCTLQDAEHRIREQIDLYRAAQKENTAR